MQHPSTTPHPPEPAQPLDVRCRAQYPHRRPSDRIVECALQDGHLGDHLDNDRDPLLAWEPAAQPPHTPAVEHEFTADDLTAEQKIRGWAIDTAAYHHGDGDLSHSSPAALVRDLCEIADLIAAYVRTGARP